MPSTPLSRAGSWTRSHDWPGALTGATTRQLVLGVGTLMIAIHLAFRAWALYPSWFYNDDFRFLREANSHRLTWRYLSTPYDSQFMPLGRGIAWLVSHAGQVNWGLAASLSMLFTLLSAVTCLWMLVTLFGSRWAILAPLGLYLCLAITMPATMWWAASLNQLPLQVVLCASVTTWVRYLRGRRYRWLAATIAVLAVGLLAYVKTLLAFGVLAFVVLAYFSSGNPWRRLRQAVRHYWPAALAAFLLAGAFTLFYTTQVPQILTSSRKTVPGGLADTMLGTSLSTGMVGGPWRWGVPNPPVALADPPAWTVHLSWVLVVLTVLVIAARRVRTGRAWLLLSGYVAATYGLVLASRATVVGPVVGREYRYLTDVLPMLALCIGLATMPLLGAVESSDARPEPLLTRVPGPRWRVAAVVAVCLSGLMSSATYAWIWHHDNPGAKYLLNAAAGLRGQGTVDLAEQVVPEDVIAQFQAPNNSTKLLLPLVASGARFPHTTDDLVMLDDTGAPHHALINPAATSERRPAGACGWRIGSVGRTVPLDSATPDFSWWARIGYLSSAQDVVTVQAGTTTTEVPVRRGLHNLFVRVNGEFSSLRLSGVGPDTILCVDTIQVGQPEAGTPL